MTQFSARSMTILPSSADNIEADATPRTWMSPRALRALPPTRFARTSTVPPRETRLPYTSPCTVMLSASITRFSWTSPNSS